MADPRNPDDEMRQCPTCRMDVSIWATKCHHCGEEVGRPRREETKLTLKDLGGTSKDNTYVPSGNVTGALESFRVDEVAAEASRAAHQPVGLWGSLTGKKKPLAEVPNVSPGDAPGLDEYSKNLAASILDDAPPGLSSTASRGSSRQAPAPPIAGRIIKGGAVLVGLLVAYFVGSFAWSQISAYLEAKNRPLEVVYINLVPEMLASGEISADVFEEAAKALSINNTDANQKILTDVRTLLVKDIDEMLTRNPWKLEDHDEAYRYIQRAVNVDSHPILTAKFSQVNDELTSYKFVLKAVDTTETSATFRLNHSDFDPEETVEVAERLMGRFIVQRISKRGVELVDDKVDGRKLRIRQNEGVKSRY